MLELDLLVVKEDLERLLDRRFSRASLIQLLRPPEDLDLLLDRRSKALEDWLLLMRQALELPLPWSMVSSPSLTAKLRSRDPRRLVTWALKDDLLLLLLSKEELFW